MSAIVSLGALWLNSAIDLSDGCSFAYVTDLNPGKDVAGESRTGPSGRMRAVLTGGGFPSLSFKWDLSGLTDAQIGWLESHVAQLMSVRDDRGRKWYGTYFSVPVTESVSWRGRDDVSLTLVEVTHDEAV